MTEDDARAVELVRAVELEDRDGVLLTREDRAAAEAHARRDAGDTGSQRGRGAYLAARARFAATRLATRHPGIEALLRRSRWPGWLGIALPLLALAAGVLANEFGTDQRLDLLAVPLLGTVAWNLAVYLWILVAALVGMRAGRAAAVHRPLADLIARAPRPGELERGSALDRAAQEFRRRWARLSAPLAAARMARTLHLGAALFAAGLIAGIYARALVTEYRAGWESTFLGAETVHWLLATLLGPASIASGVPIPPLAEIAAMRWTGDEMAGVNAGPWIHLYTLTVAALVIAPRLLLALGRGLRGWRLARSLPVAGREDFYIRRLLRASGGAPGRARVTPYAYRPGEETRRRLAAALREALDDGAQVHFDEGVDYGAEDRWLESHTIDPEDDYHLLLFTLSSTPEAENHGALATALARETASRAKGTVLGALVDESPYRAHFAGQAGLDERVATRLAAWRTVLGEAGLDPLGVDLSADPAEGLAQKIEAGLIRDGALG